MKKMYVAPCIAEHDAELSQIICGSMPSNNGTDDDKIKGEESLSNGNNDSWGDWDDDDSKK